MSLSLFQIIVQGNYLALPYPFLKEKIIKQKNIPKI